MWLRSPINPHSPHNRRACKALDSLEHHSCVHLCPHANETSSLPPLVGWEVPVDFWRCSTIGMEGWKLFPGHQEVPHSLQGAPLTLGAVLLPGPSPAPSCCSTIERPLLVAGPPPGCVLTQPAAPTAQLQQLSSACAQGCSTVASADTGPVVQAPHSPAAPWRQLWPCRPSSYFCDGSSWCCLGKWF